MWDWVAINRQLTAHTHSHSAERSNGVGAGCRVESS